MERTPYGVGPYKEGYAQFGGSQKFREKGYIFAYQDVRGQYMSQGKFVNIRPLGGKVDESTDTYDTVDWLVKHVANNNGAVGLWGISYPGFYAAAGAVNSHPALKAVSPQAPCSDWFLGDDIHHNGAFFIEDNFDFSSDFDVPRKGLETDHSGIRVDRKGKSAYDFFLDAGTVQGLDERYLKGRVPYWNEVMDHPNYDQYWKDRSLPAHFKNVHCAVLTVGGWFDAEDMWGALNLYQASKRLDHSYLVMGPWYHGMWAEPFGKVLGDLDFGQYTSRWFQENVEFPFFEKYLRGQDVFAPAAMTAFETGNNRWRTFDQWPPSGLRSKTLYLSSSKLLTVEKPADAGQDSYVYDPAHPTPYIADFRTNNERTRTYMVDDQRWAEARPDVLTYRETPLDQDMTVAGPIDVDLWTSTTGTDADFVVKVIDVWPNGNEQNLRADIMRGRYRDSFEVPKPFVPGQPTEVHFKLNDVLHTFKKGHAVMVQIQSAWFPLVDRNPNRFVDIYRAKPEDFQPATISILHSSQNASHLTFGTLTQ
jgi:hypothetical protein